MKKPFKYTMIGKFLKSNLLPILAEGSNFIPVVGPVISNVITESKGNGENEIVSPVGSLDLSKAKLQAIGLLLVGGVLIGLALSMGWLTLDEIKSIVYLLKDVSE